MICKAAFFLGLLLLLVYTDFSSGFSVQLSNTDNADEVRLSDLLMLFHRITEPVFTLRGLYRDAIFDIPEEYMPERYKKLHSKLYASAKAAGVRRIPIKKVPTRDSLLETLTKLGFWDLYIPNDPDQGFITLKFYHFFMDQEAVEDFLSAAVWARLHFNPEMIIEAIREAILDRPDTQGLQIPEFHQFYTDQFVHEGFYAKARKEMWMFADDPPQRRVIPVMRNNTTEKGTEELLSFFREDPGMPIFHTHWHLIYPYSGEPRQVIKHRRGELFTHFHRQLLARYNANRFNFNMERVRALSFEEPVKAGYVPKMMHMQSTTCYTWRPANMMVEGPNKEMIKTWIRNSEKAIQDGFAVRKNGSRVPFYDWEDMDVVEDMLEAVDILSPNLEFYGNIHNMLHDFTANASNPWGLFDEGRRVVNTLYTVRDPGFYNIHMRVDDLFESYRLKLKPYAVADLEFPGVSVTGVQVESDYTKAVNEFHTFWLNTDMDVALGMQYTPPGPLFARFQRMVHEPFTYRIQVNNAGPEAKEGFVRLFLLIQTDEKGQPLDLRSMQRWSIELDRFKATLVPGVSEITRKSMQSSVSIDPNLIYIPQETMKDIRSVNHCRCALPMSLLIPRGTEEGTRYKLMAMVSDYEKDGIDPPADEICREGWSLCGAREAQYPDKRPMGYPFDRSVSSSVTSIEDFLTANMALQDVVIKFTDRVQEPSSLLPGGISTSWTP